MRQILAMLLGSLALLSSGCSPTKGYAGPELPPTQVSLITRDYDSETVDLNVSKVDGYDFGYAGISVLPGDHLFDLQITAKEPPKFCRPFAEFNDYSWKDCLKDERKGKRSCDCYEYITVKESCVQVKHDGSCRGEGKTVAGRKYDVQISSDGRDARATITEQGSSRPSGELRCVLSNEYDSELTRDIGTGSYNANRYGFGHYCN